MAEILNTNNMKLLDLIKEIKPEILHNWYLEATKELNPESYNPKAQKRYEDLTEEQKFIDKYICNKINKSLIKILEHIVEEGEEKRKELIKILDYGTKNEEYFKGKEDGIYITLHPIKQALKEYKGRLK